MPGQNLSKIVLQNLPAGGWNVTAIYANGQRLTLATLADGLGQEVARKVARLLAQSVAGKPRFEEV